MGATFWYYPFGGQPLKEVDTGMALSEIVVREVRDEVVHETISGRRVKVAYSSRWLVRVISELITDQDVIHELEAVCNHLHRGGKIAVGESNNKTLGAFLRVAPEAGDTNLYWHNQLYSEFGGTYTPDAGDVLLLRGPSPRGLREDVVAISSVATTGATLSTATRYDWTDQPWIFVHHRGFWPVLQVQRGHNNDQFLQSTRRIHYTLDLPLEEAPNALDRLAEAPEEGLPGATFEEGVPNLDERVGPGDVGSSLPGVPGSGTGGKKNPPWWF